MRKAIAYILCALILVLSASCGSDNENNTITSQKVYNTSFRQATSASVFNTSASQVTNETSTEQPVLQETTIARTGNHPIYKQDKDMRSIKSSQMLSEINAGIVLGDSFNAHGVGKNKKIEEYETYFNNPKVSEELIESYSKAGFKAVRVPISWEDHLNENGYIDDEWLYRVEQVVKQILDKNMYCIINSQNDYSIITTNEKNFSKTKENLKNLWNQISLRFIEYNDHLLFEAFGELLKADNDRSLPSQTDIKNANILNQIFVNTVRATGKNNKTRHLIVSPYGSFVDNVSMDGFKVPTDTAKNRLIAKVNIYSPSSFCLDESSTKVWGNDDNKQYINSLFSAVNKRFSEIQIPVIVGEFGAIDKGNQSARALYASHFVATAYNYYIVCFWNDNGNNMQIINRKTAEISQTKIVNSIITAAK